MPEKSTTEVETLRAENAALKAEKERNTFDDAVIAKKMAAGLSREQAIQVIGFQRAEDARVATEKAAKSPPATA